MTSPSSTRAPTGVPALRVGALEPYERALRHGIPVYLRRADGRCDRLEVSRWRAAPDAADDTVLARCAGATLDIGCGPGRLVAALVRRGVPTLGIDVAGAAVRLTVEAGGAALRRSVFDPLPGEGRWTTALLVDGNIGIGGDPETLLARVAALLGPDGEAVVETDAQDPDVYERFAARVEDASGRGGTPFRWARVGAAALARAASGRGFEVRAQWGQGERQFVALGRALT